MAQVFALWHGGTNYSGPDFPRDLEMFNSLDEAVETCQARMNAWHTVTFDYLNRDSETVLAPNVDEFSLMHVYFADPTDSHDPYPDRMIEWDFAEETFVEVSV